MYLRQTSQRPLHYKGSIPIPNSGHLSTSPLSNFPQNRFYFFSILLFFLLLIHSPQLPRPSGGQFQFRVAPRKLTRHPPRSGDLKPLRASLSPLLRRSPLNSPTPTRPARKRMFRPGSKRSPAPSCLLVIAHKVPPPRASSPASPCPAALVFIPPVTRGSGKPEVGGAGKRAESESHGAPLFPLSDWVLDCSEPPLYCGIAAPCLRRPDPQGAHLLAPPVV